MQSSEIDPSSLSRPRLEYQPGHHWVSPLNFDGDLREGYAFPQPLTIFDSTVRKTLYTSGLRPSTDDMLHVAEALEEIGIREVAINVHWWGDPTPEKLEYEVCRAILARGFGFHVTVYSECFTSGLNSGPRQPLVFCRQAIDTLRDIGMHTLEMGVDDPRDSGARGRQVEQLPEIFSYAGSIGVSCVLALSDVGRMDLEHAVRVTNEAIRLGAVRVELLDSASSLSPEAARLFVTRFKSRLVAEIPVTMHIHDDFGLGTAAVIGAASAGAHPDVAVNGVSYRSGFPALEEVAVSLELLYGVSTGLRLDRLQHLSDLVAERIGLPNHPLKPITGSHAFIRDLPQWIEPYLKGGPDVFPPPGSCFAPSVVGARMPAVWGNHHSSAAVRAKLDQLGLKASEEQVLEIRRVIESRVQGLNRYPRWLTEEEVAGICHAVVS